MERNVAVLTVPPIHIVTPSPPICIAAVFACYNRSAAAMECLRRLRAQSRPPEMVVVADNASTDGTEEALRSFGWDALEVIQTGDNLGNAGGVYCAMEHAFSAGADAVWILDDDSWPRTAALEALLEGEFSRNVVRHCTQVDPISGHFSWPLPVRQEDGSWTTLRGPEEWRGGARMESRASWTGALIPWEVRKKAGPVLGELFIRGEDEEYPRRIAAAGFRFEAIRDAVLDHPAAKNLRRWKIGKKDFWFETGLENWKFYYEVRNTMWIKLRDGSPFDAWGIGILHLIATLFSDGWSISRLKTWVSAVKDACAGRLGRKDFPRIA